MPAAIRISFWSALHETRDFFQSFPGNPFGYVYDEDPGAHTWEFWDEHLKRFLGFLHDYALI